MAKDILYRIKELLQTCIELDEIDHADFDELKLLHRRSRLLFPIEFNELMETAIFRNSGLDITLFKRLTRILHVFDALPPEFREITAFQSAETTELIPLFELENSDKLRIFELCTGMRKIVFNTQEFDQPHRKRLLDRIAAIEAETHKPKGMFDVVRGGINDLGETLGKFGTDIKPLTDRMREVVGIARKGTKEYDQLPAPDEVKRLPAPSAEESADS